MTVHVVKFPKPVLAIELVAGGSLTVGQEYFFTGYFQRGGGYYGQAASPAADEVSITPTEGNQSIKITWGDLPTYADGIIFRWDKHTMINAGDSEFYQWLNLNDPANNGKDEFDETYGHRKWTARYSTNGHGGTSNTWVKEATSYNANNDELHDGAIEGSSYTSRAMQHPQLAIQDTAALYPLPTGFARDQGKLLIYLDNATANDQDDLIDALEASGYNDQFVLSHSNNKAGRNDRGCTIIAMAMIDVQTAEGNNVLSDINLTLICGTCIPEGIPAGSLTINRCHMVFVANSASFWVWGSGTINDSSIDVLGGTFILDDYVASGFAPKGSMTFYYYSFSGYNMIGGFGGATEYFQWRYPNHRTSDALTDFYIKNFYIYMTYRANYPTTGTHLIRVEFVNEGLKSRDIRLDYSYCDGNDIVFVHNCVDVTCDRADGKIRIDFDHSIGDPNSISDIWNFRYNINLNVSDSDGTAIEGATVTLADEDGGTDSDTSDVNGEASIAGLSYIIEYDAADSDGYGFKSKTSALKDLTLTISKPGYRTYELTGFTLTEGADWTVALQDYEAVEAALTIDIQEDSVTGDVAEDDVTGDVTDDAVTGDIEEDSLTGDVTEDAVTGDVQD